MEIVVNKIFNGLMTMSVGLWFGAITLTTIFSCNMSESSNRGNKLVHESSPYLLQHAYNPVNWYPWGEEALEKAKKENKMIIISIGYAACHWCHVMEHESFENDSVAQIMNENFVCIKVDREERPDIDDVYMTACHLASGGSCGWPLNAFALPDARPVWAGTYFPKDRWIQILHQFSDLFKNDIARLERSAEGITKGINVYGGIELNNGEEDITTAMLDNLRDRFLENLDYEQGGSQGQPKFPMPNNFEYLMHDISRSENSKAKEGLEITLDKMAAGGIYDHLGGGFARYSVDGMWRVPHFEKMLYDNGQLLTLYADAYRMTNREDYLKVVEESADFILREMRSEEGGFYSSYDADSEGEEGTFYVWEEGELDSILGDFSNIFKSYYSVKEGGNWEGKNILYKSDRISDILQQSGMSKTELDIKFHEAKSALFKVRESREKPGLDDKILASWNGLALSGLIAAYKATTQQKYLDAALNNARFLQKNMIDADFRIWRNYKNEKATINGFLDDYANVIKSFIELYEQTFDKEWLEVSRNLMFYTLDHFTNDSNFMFYYTSDIDPPLVARKTDYSDNVIPGSNSVMAHNLFKIGTLLGNEKWIERSVKMLNNMIPTIMNTRQPGFYSNWIKLMISIKDRPFEIAIVGPDAAKLKGKFDRNFIPNAIFLGGEDEGSLPLLEDKLVQGETIIYVCQNKVCKLPVTEINEALKLMK